MPKESNRKPDANALRVANKILREQLEHERREKERWRTIANVCADRVRELTGGDQA